MISAILVIIAIAMNVLGACTLSVALTQQKDGEDMGIALGLTLVLFVLGILANIGVALA